MQLRYVFSELGQGLRRNLSMHLAVILTLFVSLTLVGLGVLLNQQSARMGEQYGNELQVTVFLCRDSDENPACPTEVTPAQQQAIEKVVDENPEVESWYVESKATAFQKVKDLFGPERFEGANAAATVEDMPKSIWITLDDPDEYEGVVSAVSGLDGVGNVRDQRAVVTPILESMRALQIGSFLTAVFLVIAALLLVANTIRLAALARRKEIGIMRLVGASTLYIALPFLMEAIVTAVIGVALSAGTIAAFMYFGVEQRLRDFVGFIPWVGWDEFMLALLAVAALGPVLTLLPTLVLTRKYLKV
jgi:cell division transport system permease protein